MKTASNTAKGDSIIPDLCNSRALLVLMTLAQLLVIADVLFTLGIHMDWGYFGLSTLYVQWQALTSAGLLCHLRTTLGSRSDVHAMLLAYCALLLLAISLSLFVQWLSPFTPIHGDRFDWGFVIKNSLLSAIIIGIGLHYIYLQQRILLQQRADLHAELMALQARIRPHFLFNCLNSIAALISQAPDKAEQMVVDLSALLRASLRDGLIETSIHDEWQLCQHYLQIEAQRLGNRLGWDCDFSGLDTELTMPSLSLQPVIENAIYHGIQPNPAKGHIQVIGKNQNNRVEITVINTQLIQPDNTHNRSTGHQMALANIRDRLQRLYGNNATLRQTSANDTYKVSLCFDLSERRL